ncbi:hypothetical protein BH23THE1_BH23THE1_32130 [soil metagenome]
MLVELDSNTDNVSSYRRPKEKFNCILTLMLICQILQITWIVGLSFMLLGYGKEIKRDSETITSYIFNITKNSDTITEDFNTITNIVLGLSPCLLKLCSLS